MKTPSEIPQISSKSPQKPINPKNLPSSPSSRPKAPVPFLHFFLNKSLRILFYALPAVLFFSYYPVISLGANSSMNFELSLPLIWLVLFDIFSFFALLSLKNIEKSPKFLQNFHIFRQKHQKSSPNSQNSEKFLPTVQNSAKSSNNPQDRTKSSVVSQKSPSVLRSFTKNAQSSAQFCTNRPKFSTRDNGLFHRNPQATQSFPQVVSQNSIKTASVASPEPLGAPQISDRRFFIFALFPLYATLSSLWSANPLRAILTSGIIWLVFFAVFSILFILPRATQAPKTRHSADFTKNPCITKPSKTTRAIHFPHISNPPLFIFFFATAIVCIFCIIQCVLDLSGVSRDATLLCAGCTYRSFGFPHPSGFAIEPQFMGNLLLAPTLTALYLCCFDKPPKHGAKSKKYVIKTERQNSTFPQPVGNSRPPLLFLLCALFFSFTLFLTFSRGAIYAFIVAILAMLVFLIIRRSFKRIFPLIITPVIAFILALLAQGIMAAAGPTSETFASAIAKSVHQLSLGVVDFRSSVTESHDSSEDPSNPANSPEIPSENLSNPADSSENPAKTSNSSENLAENPPESPIFSGYVAESTNIRLSLNSVALSTWLSAPGYPEFWIAYNCHGLSGVCTSSRSITPLSIIFGTGLGSAGTVMHISDPTSVTSSKEIVQNQPISLLLETGLVGIALIVISLILAFSSRDFWHHPALPLLLPLILAYFITLQFFSGLPNALQIYLLPPFLYLIFLNFSPQTPQNSQNSSKSLKKSCQTTPCDV